MSTLTSLPPSSLIPFLMLTYLFTSSVLLLVFALGYFIFLRQAPALALRRRVLLLGVVGVVLLPLCPTPTVPQVVAGQVSAIQMVESWEMETLYATPSISTTEITSDSAGNRTASPQALNPKGLVVLGYGLVVLLFLGRLLVGLTRLAGIHRRSRRTDERDVRITQGQGEAFTFGRTVYLSEAVYDSADADVIIAHERAHAGQLHTLDALLLEVFRVVFWFHPMAWWLREQVQLNLEYLADAAVLRAGYDRRAYQLSLVAHQQGADFRTSLLPQFAAKGLKRRIKMMGFQAGPQVRSLVAVGGLIFVGFVAFACTAGEAEVLLVEDAEGSAKPGIAPLFNGEATELNVYFKRLPTPEEVVKIRPYLKDYFQKDISVYQRCSDPQGKHHLHLGSNQKSLSGVISWTSDYYSSDVVRFQFTKNGQGSQGSSTFRPLPPPAGAPDADVFLSVNGKWTAIDVSDSEPYTEATLDPLPLQAEMECRLGFTPENKDKFERLSIFTEVGKLGSKSALEVIEEKLSQSKLENLPRTYYLDDREVNETEFNDYKKGEKRTLYIAARSKFADGEVVVMVVE